jgi:aminoglycoside phosphotransferase (APT) family kinase protein
VARDIAAAGGTVETAQVDRQGVCDLPPSRRRQDHPVARLLHTDVHRKNMIVADGRTFFLDWELALWGDPVYDLAVHLHKTAYQPDEADAVRAGWLAAVPSPAGDGWERDLDAYLAHERAKSAIVDTVRYTKLIAAGNLTPQRHDELVGKLAAKLSAARAASPAWHTHTPLDPADVATRIRHWTAARRT